MTQLGNLPPGLPPAPGNPAALTAWGNALVQALTRVLGNLMQDAGQQPHCPTFLTAAIPPAGPWKGRIIFVSDGAAGSKFQGSTGSAWVSLG